jgi:hypothetical protein
MIRLAAVCAGLLARMAYALRLEREKDALPQSINYPNYVAAFDT